MLVLLYRLFIRIHALAIRLAAPAHPKARRWVAGRRGWARRMELASHAWSLKTGPLLWMHCASLGEFEQGRPLIEAIKHARPETKILLTFFSPSGYEVRRSYSLAEHVMYLPVDTPANARRFVALAQPDLVVFVKYEFWYEHLRAVQQAGITLLLISALFRPAQLFFHPWGGPFRRLLAGFTQIFTQDAASMERLLAIGIRHCMAVGDTRVDRARAIAAQAEPFPLVDAFLKGAPTLIAGSTWPPDEAILAPLLNQHLPPQWKAIIAPHRVESAHIESLERRLRLPTQRYSQLARGEQPTARALIIDNIGMLSALYQYGRVAYIGGGFGVAIHNVLEPAAFALPVLFGPRYGKFEEARWLVERGGAFPVTDADILLAAFERLLEPAAHKQAADAARAYLRDNQGATEKIVDFLRNANLFHFSEE
jgi:3-deoxy-D-manno-octulosonic-acid transferase